MIGSIVGQRYRIVRPIGSGGMGTVYEATDAASGERVAVKIITAESAQNATQRGRFEREARATMALGTPHIVRVFDAGFDGGRPPMPPGPAGTDGASGLPFLVMEYLEGEDVNQLIKRLGPLPPDLALRIVAQACAGLAAAHEARIIHRDIKPANFFLARGAGSERTVKLLDFGIAKIMRDPGSNAETAGLTSTGSMLGSPLYMAPEQARGLKEIDHRADVWSMGVVLYQALTGRTPHHDTDALGELIIAICTEVPPPIQELAPWVPPAAAAIAHQAMRFDPAERFQSVAEMLAALQPLLPNGSAIDERMFRALADAERSRVEPRYLTAPDAPPARGSRTNADGSGSAARGASFEGFGTTVGAGGAAASAPAAASSRGLVIAGGALALVAGGLLAYQLLGAPKPSPTVAASASASAPAASGTAVEAAPKPRTVRLVILPEGASVEVDGAPVEVKDGVVEITGTLGSVHDVRVTSGNDQITRSVVVAESGPVPAKVQIEPKVPKPGPPVRPAGPRPQASDLRNQR